MSYFKYKGYNEAGEVVEGEIEAGSREQASSQLHERGILPEKLKAYKPGKRNAGKIKTMDIVVFTRLLATMVNANIPLLEGLVVAESQLGEGQMRQIVRAIINDIQGGMALSEALAVHPGAFSRLYCAMVKAGEVSGRMGIILEQLFSFMERMENLKRKIVSALVYPSIILALAVAIITVFLVVFIPQFQETLSEMEDQLPAITQFFITMSEWFRASAVYLIGGLVVFGIVFWQLLKTERGRLFVDRVKFRIPVMGELVRKVVIVRVTRTMSTLLGNGVPIIDTISIVAAASGNHLMESLLMRAQRRVADGERLAETLASSPFLPKMVLQMTAMGEETGRLSEMLGKVADFYDADVDVVVDRLTSILTPILVIGLGLFVGLVVVALFLPMFSMSQLTY